MNNKLLNNKLKLKRCQKIPHTNKINIQWRDATLALFQVTYNIYRKDLTLTLFLLFLQAVSTEAVA